MKRFAHRRAGGRAWRVGLALLTAGALTAAHRAAPIAAARHAAPPAARAHSPAHAPQRAGVYNTGISDDSNPTAANFDGAGNSYSAQALQAAGISPGQPVTYDGVTFLWPRATAGTPDNVVAAGETITFPTPLRGTTLAFLGAASGGPSYGTGTITYRSGFRQSFYLALSDWTLNRGASQPSFGNGIVATMAYRNSSAGRSAMQTYLFYEGVRLYPGAYVASVTLPAAADHGFLHVFALRVATPSASTPTPTPSGTVPPTDSPTAVPTDTPTTPPTSTPTASPTSMPTATPTMTGPPPPLPGDWSMYRFDVAGSGDNPAETAINQSTVGSLKIKWDRQLPPINSSYLDTISTGVLRVNGVLYWGSWDGDEHASRASDGSDIWSANLGSETDTNCSPPELGVASTAAYTVMSVAGTPTPVLFVGGGTGTFYALNAATGATIWSHSFGSPQDGYFLWASPTVYDGSVYMGIASVGDCPLVHGQVVKMDETTGAIQATWDAQPAGCSGSGVWGSLALDTSESPAKLYFTTGTTGGCSGTGQAVVEITADTLSTVGVWQVPASEQVPDGDFGTTPTLFTATIDGIVHQMVGAINKNDVFYAFDRDNLAAGPVWSTGRLGNQGRSIASAAWDGASLYVASYGTTYAGSCDGKLQAIDPATGALRWQFCSSAGGADTAVLAVPGLVVAALGSELYAVNSASGQILWSYQDTTFNWFYAPPTISQGTLYAPNSDGNLFAFTPNGQ